MASRFLSDCEAVSIRLNQAPKGPVRKLFVSSWLDSNRNRARADLAWPWRTMSLEAQMPWRDTIRLILLAVLIAALATAAIKLLVDQLS
jgi:hypothetical protein